MKKIDFILALHDRLAGLPQEEVEERLNFYSEMIDDRVEEGLSEEEAVAAVGTVDEVVHQIVAETPLSSFAKEWVKPKRKLGPWEIVLLVLGSPLWLSLGIAAFAVVFSVYISLWAVVISLWSVPVSLLGSAMGCVALAVLFAVRGSGAACAALLGAALICAGLSVFAFIGCRACVKGAVWLSRRMVLAIKDSFAGRRACHE